MAGPDASRRAPDGARIPGGITVVLLAHGSPDPRHAEDIEALARQAVARLGAPVRTAYLAHTAPSAQEVAERLARRRLVVLVPLLLADGHHARLDVPRVAAALAGQGSTVRIADVLGPHRLLDAAVRECATAGDTGHGTGSATGRRAVVAPTSWGDAELDAACRSVATDAVEPVVVPWTLARGRLREEVEDRCARLGWTVAAEPLARTAAMADLVAVRTWACLTTVAGSTGPVAAMAGPPVRSDRSGLATRR